MKQEANSNAEPFHNSASPLIVNFGGGVDSTAILVGLVRRFRAGDSTARPALVIFADTGSELPETYDNVERVSAWLTLNDFPAVTVVSRPSEIKGRAGYKTLEENCLVNETLPGEAFGRGNCSCKWKHEPMDKFLYGGKRPDRAGWLVENGHEGQKPTKCIGYDATEAQSGKRAKNVKLTEDDRARYRYPLVEWSWTRERCEQEIAAEGIAVPVKSACFFCPNQRPCELRTMAENHPALFLRALVIEEVARLGRHGLTTIEGLWRRTRKSDGRSGSWVEWARVEGLLAEAERRTGTTLAELVKTAKPELGAAVTVDETPAPLPSVKPKRETVVALVARLSVENPDARFAELVALAVDSGANENTARGALVRMKAAA